MQPNVLVHDTAFKVPLNIGTPSSDQLLPFHRSSTFPTAMQNVVLVHEIPLSAVPELPGLATIDQLLPFHRSIRGRLEVSTPDFLMAEEPTAMQNDAFTHATDPIWKLGAGVAGLVAAPAVESMLVSTGPATTATVATAASIRRPSRCGTLRVTGLGRSFGMTPPVPEPNRARTVTQPALWRARARVLVRLTPDYCFSLIADRPPREEMRSSTALIAAKMDL
jgi:hypothetical protein